MLGEVVAMKPGSARTPCAGGCLDAPAGAGGLALWSQAREVYKPIDAKETTVLMLPWAPRIDVIFVPRDLSNVAGGLVRVLARVPGAELEIARGTFVPPSPLRLSALAGAETYVIKASLTFTNPALATPVDAYVYARVYHGG
jgi:hypothetical protein